MGCGGGGIELLAQNLFGRDLLSCFEARGAVVFGDAFRLRCGARACAQLRAMG